MGGEERQDIQYRRLVHQSPCRFETQDIFQWNKDAKHKSYRSLCHRQSLGINLKWLKCKKIISEQQRICQKTPQFQELLAEVK